MNVLENIEKSISLLKEVENYNDELIGENGLISTCDKKIDFWEHYLELETLRVTQVYNICKEIKNQRNLRRKYKNDAELIKLFKDNEAKMQHVDHRALLLTQLYKTDTKQKNAKYSYSAYTEEEKNRILGIKKEGE